MNDDGADDEDKADYYVTNARRLVRNADSRLAGQRNKQTIPPVLRATIRRKRLVCRESSVLCQLSVLFIQYRPKKLAGGDARS